MALRTTATNAQFDAALALIPTEYGTWARASGVDLEAAPTAAPNSNVEYGITNAASGTTTYITYEKLTGSAAARNAFIKEALGVRGVLIELQQFFEAMYLAFSNTTMLSASPLEYQAYMKAVGALPQFVAQIPHEAYTEVRGSNDVLLADFTVVQSGDNDEIAAITNDTTGEYHFILWSMGDGTVYRFNDGPITHTFTAAAAETTPTVRLLVIGPGGVVSTHSEQLTVAGTAAE